MNYYCNVNICPFDHDGWCAYWDSTIELMNRRKKSCPMNRDKQEVIDMMMGE